MIALGGNGHGRASAASGWRWPLEQDRCNGLAVIAPCYDARFDLARELFRLADIGTALLEETGKVVNALPFPAGAYSERTPIMHEIRHSGIDL